MRNQNSHELAHAEQDWLRVTLSSIGDAVITTDTSGRVTFLNELMKATRHTPSGYSALLDRRAMTPPQPATTTTRSRRLRRSLAPGPNCICGVRGRAAQTAAFAKAASRQHCPIPTWPMPFVSLRGNLP